MPRQHFTVQSNIAASEQHASTRLELLSGMYERVPLLPTPGFQLPTPKGDLHSFSWSDVVGSRELAGREFAKQKTFHSAAARNPDSDETRRKHARVVEHEQITGAQMP